MDEASITSSLGDAIGSMANLGTAVLAQQNGMVQGADGNFYPVGYGGLVFTGNGNGTSTGGGIGGLLLLALIIWGAFKLFK